MKFFNLNLPCAKGKCPHHSVCCKYGVDIDEEEARIIAKVYGKDCIIQDGDNIRTRVKNEFCIFLKNGKCEIHDQPFYPKVCKIFPLDGYQGDPYLCPSVKNDHKKE